MTRGREDKRTRGGEDLGTEITVPSPHRLTSRRLITSLWPSVLIFFTLVECFMCHFYCIPVSTAQGLTWKIEWGWQRSAF